MKTPTGKGSKGTVQVINSNKRLQLRFRFLGKRHYLSLGLPDKPLSRKLAEIKAREIEFDILNGEFDQTLQRYKSKPLLRIKDLHRYGFSHEEMLELFQTNIVKEESAVDLEAPNEGSQALPTLIAEELARQQERREIIKCFLNSKFGKIDEKLSQIVEPLAHLSPGEFTNLLVTLSYEGLISRFNSVN